MCKTILFATTNNQTRLAWNNLCRAIPNVNHFDKWINSLIHIFLNSTIQTQIRVHRYPHLQNSKSSVVNDNKRKASKKYSGRWIGQCEWKDKKYFNCKSREIENCFKVDVCGGKLTVWRVTQKSSLGPIKLPFWLSTISRLTSKRYRGVRFLHE
jgi:hypothetical protein